MVRWRCTGHHAVADGGHRSIRFRNAAVALKQYMTVNRFPSLTLPCVAMLLGRYAIAAQARGTPDGAAFH